MLFIRLIFILDHKLSSDWVTDIECIRRALEVDKFSMVGHSLGGIISLIYSATYPDCIDKTVTIDAIYPSLSEPEEVNQFLK